MNSGTASLNPVTFETTGSVCHSSRQLILDMLQMMQITQVDGSVTGLTIISSVEYLYCLFLQTCRLRVCTAGDTQTAKYRGLNRLASFRLRISTETLSGCRSKFSESSFLPDELLSLAQLLNLAPRAYGLRCEVQ